MSRDLAIVVVAGNDVPNAKGRFWLLDDGIPEELGTNAVSQGGTADVVFDLPGRKLMLLDICLAGALLSDGRIPSAARVRT